MTASRRMDRLDAQILSLLGTDARMGVVELASSLRITRNTVQSRLKRLEESGTLTGFIPQLDLSSVGVIVEGFVELALEQGRLDSVVETLVTMPHVLEVHTITGREDLRVRLAATSLADLQDIVQDILAIPGVAHTSTTVALTNPLLFRIQPLLDHLTSEKGYGRSTPLPSNGMPIE